MLLFNENISYNIVPVEGHKGLSDAIWNYLEQGKFVLFVLINCGAMLDLTHWQPPAGEKPMYKVWLLDSHRPVLHQNLINAKNIYFVDDGTADLRNCPQPADLQLLGEDENLQKSPKKPNAPDEPEDAGKAAEEDAASPQPSERPARPLGRKRQAQAREEAQERKRLVEDAKAKVEHYYAESYTGKSVAGLLYLLCQQLRLDSNNVLWLWALGLTDQLISHRITLRDYEQEALELQREALRLNMRLFAPEETRFKSLASARKIGTVAIEKDLNLAFLRHWTLFDSLANSEATVPHLRNWHEGGRRELQRLIAKVGVPLLEAHQKFACLNPKYKEPLREKMAEVAADFGIQDVFVSAFLFCSDHRSTLNSLDVAAAARAVLDYPGCFHGLATQGEKGGEKAAHPKDNFWCVFYQLLDRNTAFLEKAVAQGVEQQKRLVALCFEVVEKKLVKAAGGFKCVVLEQDAHGEAAAMSVYALERLAQLLLQICRGTDGAATPLLLAVLSRADEAYLVVGVEDMRARRKARAAQGSFAAALKQAAEAAAARCSSDAFESFFLKVHAKDFENFVEALRAACGPGG